MKKLIDFDGLFEKKLSSFMEENFGKYTEKQWESIIPKLYKSFGDTFIPSAGNTPKGYYAEMGDEELVDTLAAHVREGAPVSDFLCNELEARNCPDGLLALMRSGEEELVAFAVNLAGDSVKAFDVYFDLLTGDLDGEVKDTVVERLKGDADSAKERAIELYQKHVEREYMLEILSRCRQRDDRVFDILMTAFRTSPDELPMHASYLASYGDERALPVLLDFIDRDETNYLEYQELKYAIEALGGEYTRIRDFSNDPYYIEIMEQSQAPVSPEEKKD